MGLIDSMAKGTEGRDGITVKIRYNVTVSVFLDNGDVTDSVVYCKT